ncbi:MAG: histidinol-phosphatase HisJ family protein [Christensenellaceae bacterium]|nr:histidinol-phosphatase HisJ family protein [Christensenellaceae bacterium]
MITRQNLHTHTNYVDGVDSPRQMVEYALSFGLESLGFSEHAHTYFDDSCCMTKAQTLEYFDEINSLKAEYKGKIDIYLGLEIDLHDIRVYEGLDYTIGSLHCLPVEGKLYPVDYKPQMTQFIKEKGYNNDGVAMAVDYLKILSKNIALSDADIVGHIDLPTKFNGDNILFDEDSSEYKNAVIKAVDSILAFKKDIVFEVNTGAISRGYRTSPYPSKFVLKQLLDRNARLCITSDCHNGKHLTCAFSETEAMLKNMGFKQLWQIKNNIWQAIPL